MQLSPEVHGARTRRVEFVLGMNDVKGTCRVGLGKCRPPSEKAVPVRSRTSDVFIYTVYTLFQGGAGRAMTCISLILEKSRQVAGVRNIVSLLN